jgi:hypothetical protein
MPRKISPLARRALGLAPSVGHTSSRVTKGKRMFIELGDGRTQWARRWADLIVAHVNDFAARKDLRSATLNLPPCVRTPPTARVAAAEFFAPRRCRASSRKRY